MNAGTYLRETLRRDIAAAFAHARAPELSQIFAPDFGSSASTTVPSKPTTDSADASDDVFAASVARLHVIHTSQLQDTKSIAACIHECLGATDVAARGVAWVVLEKLARSDTTGTVVGEFSNALSTMFGPVNDEAMSPGSLQRARLWLKCLSSHLNTVRLLRRADDVGARLLAARAGNDIDQLRSDSRIAVLYLSDASSTRRCAGLLALRLLFRHDRALVERVKEKACVLAAKDQDARVREEAIRFTFAAFQNTRDAACKRVLARIVQDECELGGLRALAYQGIFVVDARPCTEWPIVLAGHADLTALPETTDWKYVKECDSG